MLYSARSVYRILNTTFHSIVYIVANEYEQTHKTTK